MGLKIRSGIFSLRCVEVAMARNSFCSPVLETFDFSPPSPDFGLVGCISPHLLYFVAFLHTYELIVLTQQSMMCEQRWTVMYCFFLVWHSNNYCYELPSSGFYYNKKKFVILSSKKSSVGNLSCFFNVKTHEERESTESINYLIRSSL